MSSRIIIQNLPKWMTQNQLESHLKKQPGVENSISDVFVAKNKKGGRGFAFIGYKSSIDAENAVKYWNKSFINSTRIQVAIADKKPNSAENFDENFSVEEVTESNSEKSKLKNEYISLLDKRKGIWDSETQDTKEEQIKTAENIAQQALHHESFLRQFQGQDADWIKSKVSSHSQINLEKYTKAQETKELITKSCRLYIRNLPYFALEQEVAKLFDGFVLKEFHLSIDQNTSRSKGYAFAQFKNSSDALAAFQKLDGISFQGRLLHILPASEKRQIGISDEEMQKLPIKLRKSIEMKRNAKTKVESWNSFYMNADAIISSLSQRMNVEKSDIIDPTSAASAINQTVAESHIISEIQENLEQLGVNLNAFQCKNTLRSDTTLIVKNFSFGTTFEELKTLFSQCGTVVRLILPSAGTIAIIEYQKNSEASLAFKTLAYRRLRDAILYLEKAPADIFLQDAQTLDIKTLDTNAISSIDERDNEDSATIFVKNLNFKTSSEDLDKLFNSLQGYKSAVVKTKQNNQGQTLSLGYGFVEFQDTSSAKSVLQAMNKVILDGHSLELKYAKTNPNVVITEKRKRATSRLVVKNIPFETTKTELRNLLTMYGKLKSLRLPKKYNGEIRGFAFAEFVTTREAENVVNSLKHSHLLGRHLIFEWAENEDIESALQAQKKMRKQEVLQQFSSYKGARIIEDDEEEEDA